MSLKTLLDSGDVQRYHTRRLNNHQSVGSHSWGVTICLLHFWPKSSRELVHAALLHDFAEIETGDMPATFKSKKYNKPLKETLGNIEREKHEEHNIPYYRDLPKPDLLKLKICDALELVYYCHTQIMMGNLYMYEVFRSGIDTLNAHITTVRLQNNWPREDYEKLTSIEVFVTGLMTEQERRYGEAFFV